MADGNGNIPMGASFQMALRMEKKYKDMGGRIYYNKSVKKIRIVKKKATGIELEDGTFIHDDYIIPAVDTHLLFHTLLSKKYMPRELREAYDAPKSYPSTSGFQVAFTVDISCNEGKTIFIDIDPICVGSRSFDRMFVKSYGYDSIFVKDGKTVIQTCITQTDADYEFWKSLSFEEYREIKTKLTEEVKVRIENAFLQFAGNMEFLDAWTPLTYERYCNAYHGSYMSFVTTPKGKQIKMKGKLKGIKNLYVAGQWTNSPGGLPVAVASGKFAIQRILKKKRKSIEI